MATRFQQPIHDLNETLELDEAPQIAEPIPHTEEAPEPVDSWRTNLHVYLQNEIFPQIARFLENSGVGDHLRTLPTTYPRFFRVANHLLGNRNSQKTPQSITIPTKTASRSRIPRSTTPAFWFDKPLNPAHLLAGTTLAVVTSFYTPDDSAQPYLHTSIEQVFPASTYNRQGNLETKQLFDSYLGQPRNSISNVHTYSTPGNVELRENIQDITTMPGSKEPFNVTSIFNPITMYTEPHRDGGNSEQNTYTKTFD